MLLNLRLTIGTLLEMTRSMSIGQGVAQALLRAPPVSNPSDLYLFLVELFVGSPTCRFPGCNRPTLFDRRVNEMREWCSEHMRCAVRICLQNPFLSYYLLPLGLR